MWVTGLINERIPYDYNPWPSHTTRGPRSHEHTWYFQSYYPSFRTLTVFTVSCPSDLEPETSGLEIHKLITAFLPGTFTSTCLRFGIFHDWLTIPSIFSGESMQATSCTNWPTYMQTYQILSLLFPRRELELLELLTTTPHHGKDALLSVALVKIFRRVK